MGDVESREQNHLPFGKNSTLSSTINTEKNIFISSLKFREANNFQIGAVSGKWDVGTGVLNLKTVLCLQIGRVCIINIIRTNTHVKWIPYDWTVSV